MTHLRGAVAAVVLAGSALLVPTLSAPALAAQVCAGRVVTILGTPNDDVITGTAGPDVIAGLGGDDTVYGLGGSDIACLGAGIDAFDGGDGYDLLMVDPAPDGADRFNGGADIDTAYYGARSTGVSVTLDGNSNDGGSGEGDNILPDVEQVYGGSAADNLVGSASNNTLFGGGDNDRIDGGGGADRLVGDVGNDILFGGAGDDVLYGGPGNDNMAGLGGNDVAYADPTTDGADVFDGGTDRDTMDYGLRSTRIVVTLDGSPNDGATTGEGDNIAPTVEQVNGGSDRDVLKASHFGSTLIGNGGDDLLLGGPGSDNLLGSAGMDDLRGADGIQGNDVVDGGPDLDICSSDTLDLNVSCP
jgi:Ca2+-binding RTX toxin-like protein